MPLAESNPAATLTFDAAVHRALARRPSDTPWPHNGAPAPRAATVGEAAGVATAAHASEAEPG